jgi:hypothetical protein
VLKVEVETQNDESVAAVSPFIPFKVASVGVMVVAAFVAGADDVRANADGAIAPNAKPNVPVTSASAVNAETDLVICSANILFIIRING